MKALLQKLEQKAERLLAMMDDHLQDPVVRAVRGEVFTHGTPSDLSSPITPQTTTPEAATQPSQPRRRAPSPQDRESMTTAMKTVNE